MQIFNVLFYNNKWGPECDNIHLNKIEFFCHDDFDFENAFGGPPTLTNHLQATHEHPAKHSTMYCREFPLVALNLKNFKRSLFQKPDNQHEDLTNILFNSRCLTLDLSILRRFSLSEETQDKILVFNEIVDQLILHKPNVNGQIL